MSEKKIEISMSKQPEVDFNPLKFEGVDSFASLTHIPEERITAALTGIPRKVLEITDSYSETLAELLSCSSITSQNPDKSYNHTFLASKISLPKTFTVEDGDTSEGWAAYNDFNIGLLKLYGKYAPKKRRRNIGRMIRKLKRS